MSSRGAARRSCKVKTIRVDNVNGDDGDGDIDDVVGDNGYDGDEDGSKEGEQQGSCKVKTINVDDANGDDGDDDIGDVVRDSGDDEDDPEEGEQQGSR